MSQTQQGPQDQQGGGKGGHSSSQSALTLAALGVVFGDIGTSPLYAFKEAFAGTHGLAVSPENVLAALSALLWAVIIVVAIKYVWIVLSYDNDGEGGVLALGDKSPPELISEHFRVSKGNFKKAIGGLYKQGLIRIHDDRIELLDN